MKRVWHSNRTTNITMEQNNPKIDPQINLNYSYLNYNKGTTALQ